MNLTSALLALLLSVLGGDQDFPNPAADAPASQPATATRPAFRFTGRNLTPEQVKDYEERLKTEPDNMDLRQQLLRY